MPAAITTPPGVPGGDGTRLIALIPTCIAVITIDVPANTDVNNLTVLYMLFICLTNLLRLFIKLVIKADEGHLAKLLIWSTGSLEVIPWTAAAPKGISRLIANGINNRFISSFFKLILLTNLSWGGRSLSICFFNSLFSFTFTSCSTFLDSVYDISGGVSSVIRGTSIIVSFVSGVNKVCCGLVIVFNSFSSLEKVIDKSLGLTLVVGTLYSHVPSSLVVKVSFIGVVGSGNWGGLLIIPSTPWVVAVEIKLIRSDGEGLEGDEIILIVAPGIGEPIPSSTVPLIIVWGEGGVCSNWIWFFPDKSVVCLDWFNLKLF